MDNDVKTTIKLLLQNGLDKGDIRVLKSYGKTITTHPLKNRKAKAGALLIKGQLKRQFNKIEKQAPNFSQKAVVLWVSQTTKKPEIKAIYVY